MLNPTIPLYLHGLGASELLIGFVLAAFSVTSFTLRPFIGYWTDRWSAAGVLAMGLFTLATSCLGLFVPFIVVTAAANALRGIGWAELNTGANTLIAELAPLARRGEAAGYFSAATSVAGAIFPFTALWMLKSSGSNFTPVFVLALALALAGVALTLLMGRSRTKNPKSPVRSEPAQSGRGALIDRQVLFATIPQVFVFLGQPAASSFVPLFAQRIGVGLDQVSWYFVVNGLTAILGRGLLGQLSDRFGRARCVAAGFVVIAASFVLLSTAAGLAGILAAAVVYSVGFSTASSGLLAHAIDLATPQRRGTAMATFSLANQVGIGVGAPIWGGIIVLAGYRSMYIAAAVGAGLGLASMIISEKLRTRLAESAAITV